MNGVLMPRKRSVIQYEATKVAIKQAARQLMREKGTNGLSTRAVAKMVGLTAPALYHYYENLDALITALIVDAFNALADSMHQAALAEHDQSHGDQIKATVLAYRQYAIQNPIDFQLIYGNPIPGYEAPAEITVPLARRPFETLIALAARGFHEGKLHIPDEYQNIPPKIVDHIKQWIELFEEPLPVELFYVLIAGWTRIHGLVMLELFEHTPATIGYPQAFYEKEVDVYLKALGIEIND